MLGNPDMQIEAIREALRDRDNPFKKIKGETNVITSVKRFTEIKAFDNGFNSQSRTQFIGLEEFIFRSELQTLLNEYKSHHTTRAIDYHEGEEARFVGEFLKQDRVYVCAQIQFAIRREYRLYPSQADIEKYLDNVSRLIETSLAQGRDFETIPFTHESYPKIASEPKRGQAHPVIVDGAFYPTIAAAARATGYNPRVIQRQAMNDAKKLMAK
jgi:hypothetical protein